MLKYSKTGWRKYKLALSYTINTTFRPAKFCILPYITLQTYGILTILAGYEWECSGPTIPSGKSARAALVHDALYDIIRHCGLAKEYKEHADFIFYTILIEDGFNKYRAWYYWMAVKWFGKYTLYYKVKTFLKRCL